MKRTAALVATLLLVGCTHDSQTGPALRADVVGDVTPPVFTALSFTPTTINTTDNSATVTVSYTVTDDLSGAAAVAIGFADPSGSFPRGFSSDNFAPAASHSGSITFTFPQFSHPGIWQIAVQVCDAVQNCSSTLMATDLATLGFPTDLTVESVADVTSPALTALSFTPTTINTTGNSATVTASYTVTDDLSGATQVAIGFADPSGSFPRGLSGDNFAPAASHSGSITFTFPQFSHPGIWQIAVQVCDAVQNCSSTLMATDLATLGFPTDLTVESVADVTSPALTALSFKPTTINTTGNSATVTASYTVTDDLSGATAVAIGFADPSGSFPRGFNSDNFAPAASHSGSITFTFPQFSHPGIWQIAVQVCDAVQNCSTLMATDLATLGFPTTLVVQNTVPVTIDIQPGSARNTVSASKRGKVTVAILSDLNFDATSTVVRASLTFGRTGNEASLASCGKEGEDVNIDGFKDLVCQFYAQKTGFRAGDLVGILRGLRTDQLPIEGRDAVRIVK